jgi:hypothetical protein
MVENDGTGSSSTGKSLLEALHETGGGEEGWEAQNKMPLPCASSLSVILPYAASLSVIIIALCYPAARYDDSGRNPVGGDIVYHYATSPTGTDRLPSEATLPIIAGVASADFAPTTPISTSYAQQLSVGALRKQKSWSMIESLMFGIQSWLKV